MCSGECVRAKEICRGIILELQGLTVVEDFLPLELGGTDVVLGTQWLCTLGNMEVNWKLLTMHFQMGDLVMVLKGDPGLHKMGISLNAMVKTLQHEKQAIWLEDVLKNTHSKGKEEPPTCIKLLLQQFQ